MKKQALLIIDMLNDFLRQGAPLEVPDARKIVPSIQGRLKESRSKGIPVIFVCDSHEENDTEFSRMNWPAHAVRGTEGAKVVDELAPVSGETVVKKTTYSGFYNTELEAVLSSCGAQELIVTGCVTNICVFYTAADAVMRGFYVVVPADCVAGISRQAHNFALKQMQDVLGVKVEGTGKK
jgi:nicotinamidase-related amidase